MDDKYINAEDFEFFAEQYADQHIAACGAINPYTNKPFKTLRELEEYGAKIKLLREKGA